MSVAKKRSKTARQDPIAGSQTSFEQALEELESIVRQLEEGKLPLAEALAQYESGVGHLKRCYELLEQAERRIELLGRVDAQGQAVTEPFDEADTPSFEHAHRARSRRGSGSRVRTSAGPQDEIDDPGRLF